MSNIIIIFECTDEQAQYVLDKSLTNDATMEQIWLSIDTFGEMEKLVNVNVKQDLILNDFNDTFFTELENFYDIEIFLGDEASQGITKKDRKEFYSRWK